MAVENTMAVLQLIHRQTVISQRQIVEVMAMQPSTVSNIIRELRDAGIVRESGTLDSGGVGAKQISLEIDASFTWVASWLIDKKGHQICLLDAAGRTIAIEKLPVDVGWKVVAHDIHKRIQALASTRRLLPGRFAGLGISVQGIVNSESGEVVYSHPHQMEGVALRSIVEENLLAPVYIERNIPCAAYLEQNIASADRKSSFLYYLLRRHEDFFEHGVGIVLNGKVFHGSHFAAGELASDTFPATAPINTLQEDEAWDATYKNFGKTIAVLADFLDVEEVIISSDDPEFTAKRFKSMHYQITENIRPIKGREIRIVRSQVGPEGMLLGAALIVLHKHFEKAVQTLPNRSVRKPKKAQKAVATTN